MSVCLSGFFGLCAAEKGGSERKHRSGLASYVQALHAKSGPEVWTIPPGLARPGV